MRGRSQGISVSIDTNRLVDQHTFQRAPSAVPHCNFSSRSVKIDSLQAADQCKITRRRKSIGGGAKRIYQQTYVPAVCRSLEAKPSAVVESQRCVQLVWARELRDRDGVFAGVMLLLCVV